MAAKLSVGLQKKLGLPGYSSIGASCHVEFEVETSLMESNLDGFQVFVKSPQNWPCFFHPQEGPHVLNINLIGFDWHYLPF